MLSVSFFFFLITEIFIFGLSGNIVSLTANWYIFLCPGQSFSEKMYFSAVSLPFSYASNARSNNTFTFTQNFEIHPLRHFIPYKSIGILRPNTRITLFVDGIDIFVTNFYCLL